MRRRGGKAGDPVFPLITMAIEDENSKAFMTRLYLQYSRLIYPEIRKITGERDEEEDLLQTVVESCPCYGGWSKRNLSTTSSPQPKTPHTTICGTKTGGFVGGTGAASRSVSHPGGTYYLAGKLVCLGLGMGRL